jgi:hypothetical protein
MLYSIEGEGRESILLINFFLFISLLAGIP